MGSSVEIKLKRQGIFGDSIVAVKLERIDVEADKARQEEARNKARAEAEAANKAAGDAKRKAAADQAKVGEEKRKADQANKKKAEAAATRKSQGEEGGGGTPNISSLFGDTLSLLGAGGLFAGAGVGVTLKKAGRVIQIAGVAHGGPVR